MEVKSVSILGAGWLGWPLAEVLSADGWHIKASSSKAEKLERMRNHGWTAVHIDAHSVIAIPEEFWGDVLVLCFPPGRREGSTGYAEQMEKVLQQCPESVEKIILISSTSVYPKVNGDFKESDTLSDADDAKALIKAEQLVLQHSENAVVIRMGGLMGEDRNPARFGKSKLAGNEPVNMIHRRDAVALVQYFIEHTKLQGIFNGCASEHPMRRDFYEAGAKALGVETPLLHESETPLLRSINNEKVVRETDFRFQYDQPCAFW